MLFSRFFIKLSFLLVTTSVFSADFTIELANQDDMQACAKLFENDFAYQFARHNRYVDLLREHHNLADIAGQHQSNSLIPHNTNAALNALQEILESRSAAPIILVARTQGTKQVISTCFCYLQEANHTVFIHKLLINPSCDNARVGKALVKKTLSMLKAKLDNPTQARKRVAAYALVDDPAVLNLYGKIGFQAGFFTMRATPETLLANYPHQPRRQSGARALDIRPATPHELPALEEIYIQNFKQHAALGQALYRDYPGYEDNDLRADIYKIKNLVCNMTAWDGDEAVGFCQGRLDKYNTLRIDWVMVKSNCQGRGIGGQLITALVKHFMSAGMQLPPIHQVALSVLANNAPAIKCYERLGFRKAVVSLFCEEENLP